MQLHITKIHGTWNADDITSIQRRKFGVYGACLVLMVVVLLVSLIIQSAIHLIQQHVSLLLGAHNQVC